MLLAEIQDMRCKVNFRFKINMRLSNVIFVYVVELYVIQDGTEKLTVFASCVFVSGSILMNEISKQKHVKMHFVYKYLCNSLVEQITTPLASYISSSLSQNT